MDDNNPESRTIAKEAVGERAGDVIPDAVKDEAEKAPEKAKEVARQATTQAGSSTAKAAEGGQLCVLRHRENGRRSSASRPAGRVPGL